jgi:tetratricopeptide (TPR) repeat protein
LRALGNVWVWLLVRGHLRQSATLWQHIAPLLAQEPRIGADRLARDWLLAAGWTAQAEFTKVIDLVDEILPDFRRVEKPSRTAGLLMARGVVRVYTAHDLARADFAEALAVARTAGDPISLGYVQAHYGALLFLDGDLDQARALHEETLTIGRSSGDQNLSAEAHYLLATDFLAARDAGSAAQQLAAAVRDYQSFGHLEGLARCLGALSALALQRDDPRLAARLIGAAAAVRDRVGLKPWPYVVEAEHRTIARAAARLPGGEYTANVAAGRSQTIDQALTAALPILDDGQPTGTR